MGAAPTATPENHPERLDIPPVRGKNLTLLGGPLGFPSLPSLPALFRRT